MTSDRRWKEIGMLTARVGIMLYAGIILVVAPWSPADTFHLRTGVQVDGVEELRQNGVIHVRAGNRVVRLREDEVVLIEKNNRTGALNMEEIRAQAEAKNRELTEKTGLDAPQRARVDALLEDLWSGVDAKAADARKALLKMAETVPIFAYLALLLPQTHPPSMPPLMEVMFEINPPGTHPFLRELAAHAHGPVREKALLLLGKCRDRSDLDLIARGMKDHVAEVRIEAARALGALGDRRATAVLMLGIVSGDLRWVNVSLDSLRKLWQDVDPDTVKTLEKQQDWMGFINAHRDAMPEVLDPDSLEPLVPPGTEFVVG